MYEKFDKTDLGAPFNASREFKRHGQRNLPIHAEIKRRIVQQCSHRRFIAKF